MLSTDKTNNNIIVLPNQLFAEHDLIDSSSIVYLVEHPVYFTHYNFHKMRLILHRATMKYYESYLKKKYKCRIIYIEHHQNLDKELKKLKNGEVHLYDPVDHVVEADLNSIAKKNKIELVYYDNPLFLNKLSDFVQFLGSKNIGLEEFSFEENLKEAFTLSKNKNSFSHASFYRWMRKHHDILMSGGKPKGGEWSYDVQNRLPFPKNFKTNYYPKANTNKFVADAKKYVNKHFKDNPGETDLYLPVDHAGAKRHYQKFLKERFKCFGPYQDAVSEEIPFGCHSVISALLNIGLLTPEYVVKEAEKVGIKNKVPLQSVEGFIRQLFWREYCYFLYKLKRVDLEKSNHFNHKRKLDEDVWYYGEGSTGFPVIDDLIGKSLELGYLHHIERLMYIGNYFLITQIHPKEVHDWFISVVSLDAYHWVMYPNVYGMSQHSAGNIMMNRPYFSSSSYITKMSSYGKGGTSITLGETEYKWDEVWDALYYNFISEHQKEFSKNYAISAQVKHWNRKSVSEKKEIKEVAKKYMSKY